MKMIESAQQFVILLKGFTKTETRIQDQLFFFYPSH